MADALEFEGRRVRVHQGDTVASALVRDGVLTFTRSLKYHRRRAPYCLTGDCPNCLVNVDGEPGVRACTTEAREGQVVRREAGWPSPEHDLLHVTDHLHPLFPIGFYSKTFIRPRFAWRWAEAVIRRATGVGRLPLGRAPRIGPARTLHADVVVVGAGVAGLAAAGEAASQGERVVVLDEGRLGEKVWDPVVIERIEALAASARADGAEILERHTAVGVYEGPFVPAFGPGGAVHIEARRVIVATGAVEAHAVFPGNDLPGVFLARGAGRLAGRHSVAPGRRAALVATTEEGRATAEVLRAAGTEVVVVDGTVVAAEGTRRVKAVVVDTPAGRERIACDTLVLSLGWAPRDALLRMATADEAVGAGEVVTPGCSLDEAEVGGRRAAGGAGPTPVPVPTVPMGAGGYV